MVVIGKIRIMNDGAFLVAKVSVVDVLDWSKMISASFVIRSDVNVGNQICVNVAAKLL